jgi:hypothetical protein
MAGDTQRPRGLEGGKPGGFDASSLVGEGLGLSADVRPTPDGHDIGYQPLPNAERRGEEPLDIAAARAHVAQYAMGGLGNGARRAPSGPANT